MFPHVFEKKKKKTNNNNNNKKYEITRIEEENVDHGKDPHILLVALIVMLFLTGPLAEINYHNCVCEMMS